MGMGQRQPHERYGCDLCKQDRPTYGYKFISGPNDRPWFCEECIKRLRKWRTGGELMGWHYRVRKRILKTGEPWYDIVEYWDNPTGWSRDGMTPGGNTSGELIQELERMLSDANKYDVLDDKEG